MTKNYLGNVESTGDTLSPEDLALIHRFTRKEIAAENIYTFPVILCDNEVDRDFERFSVDALRTLAELFVGKTGLFNHSMDSHDQTARIYKAECRTDPKATTSQGESYTYIRAMAYMPRTESNARLIEEIDCGIKKEVSVGCAVSKMHCSICGAEIHSAPCGHTKGEQYGDKVCHYILSAPEDAYEWSFVAVPAQRNAGVTKSYQSKEEPSVQDVLKTIHETKSSLTLQGDTLNKLQKEIAELQAEAEVGKAYKASLLSETVRLGLVAMPELEAESFRTACEKMTTGELRGILKGFTALAQKQMPMTLQLKPQEQTEQTNTAFMI